MSSRLYPLILKPWLRPMPWGGDSLAHCYADHHASEPIGEAWLLSDHPLHRSVVNNGDWKGQSFIELIQQHPAELIGRASFDRFPLLLKILDAQQNLSVQVHPDDAKAQRWAAQEGGKTEAWTILQAAPGSRIYLGTAPGVSTQFVAEQVKATAPPSYLRQYEPHPGQTYYVPAGTIHALGNGLQVLEVQQTSDATFRLYDWGRTDQHGKPRALHLEAGLDCIQEHPHAGLVAETRDRDGASLLIQTEYFSIRRWRDVPAATVQAPAMIIPWQGSVTCSNGERVHHATACFIPAGLKERLQVEVGTTVFEVRLPG